MPLPTGTQVHQDVPLTNFANAIVQERSNFVARRVFPTLPVMKQSDKYYIYDQGDFARTDAMRRAPSSVAPTVGFRLSTTTFYNEVWHVRAGLDDMDGANADAVLSLAEDNVERIVNDMLLRQEKDWIAKFFVTGVWAASTTLSGTDQFENAASTPIETITDEKYSINAATGLMPNTIVMGANVEKRLINHPDIVDRIGHDSLRSQEAARNALAAILGFDRLYVLGSVENTALEGATDSFAYQAGNHALITYVSPRVGPRTPTAGLTFAWTTFPGGAGAEGFQVRQYREEAERTDYVEVAAAWDNQLVSSALGRILLSAVGS